MTERHDGADAQVPAIVLAVRRWNSALANRDSAGSAEHWPDQYSFSPGPEPSGPGTRDHDARPSRAAHDSRRAAAAAEQALLRYPGAIGRLIHDEIRAYQQIGGWLNSAVIPRVIDELMDEDAS